ncbi:1-phosphatidylinositol 4,5-bisphosphate phosphodiesterase beta-4-like isoform X2 [Dendronephthya gigantea]|uniref:1-phosphatidylinositol 4,5-bisphosphate phosphodiesterase beta-4-like isoform X2 n=1 Tax=Dendronephthya gigantea TaxID=151771 RepID=UPI00106CE8C5|nr:1-phosphatidylinositol 4,5-bisphosphate phosphodiesterase beta-4-like isoform X2 [Dendronephthya gigantea]
MDIAMQIWNIAVPNLLQSGTILHKWDEESSGVHECHFTVDRYGFFLAYREPEKEPSCVDLSNVTEVKLGGFLPKDGKARSSLECSGPEPIKDRVLTIVVSQNLVETTNIYLCSSSSRVAREWVEGLQQICNSVKATNLSVMAMLLKLYVKATLLKVNGKISVKSICKCFNCGKNYEKRILDGLQAMDLPHEKNDEIDHTLFTFETFYQLYATICPRQDFDQIFTKWQAGKAPYITPTRLMEFINTEQRDPSANEILYPYCNKEKAIKIISKYEKCAEMVNQGRMSADGLSRYLMSDENLSVKSEIFEVHQDMNQPLSHYFVNSSHNTYLTGRQIGGKSSVEIYRQCLLSGCRCIELDCWDGPNDDPIITHGKAMCTNIMFKDVIEAIRDTAFVTSEYPVLLSFENHCSKYQQYKIACYCTEILGDLLLSSPFDSHPLEENQPLPSPNHLKRKILIKNKKLRPGQESNFDSESIASSESRKSSEVRLEDIKSVRPRMTRLSEDNDGEEAALKEEDDGFVNILTDEKTLRSSINSERNNHNTNDKRRHNFRQRKKRSLEEEDAAKRFNGCIDEGREQLEEEVSNTEVEGVIREGGKNALDAFDEMMLEIDSSDSSDSKDDDDKHLVIMSNICLTETEAMYPTLSKDKRTTKLPPEVELMTARKSSSASTDSTQSDEERDVKRSESFASFGSSIKIVQQRQNSQSSISTDEVVDILANYHHSASLSNIHPSLSCLVNYMQPIPFPGFERSEEANLHYRMSSFNEVAAFTLLKGNPVEFVRYNQRQLSRIYPKGSRVDSSNYMPQVFWNAGTQMVALNLQTTDLAFQLNSGKFVDNGRCGYLLKPSVMRKSDKNFDPFTELPVDGVVATCISIKVISGQFLSDKRVGTYVEVDLYGLPTDTVRKRYKTKIVNSNGMNPVYDSEDFSFKRIVLPELALLRFTVLDDSDRVLGQRVIPVSSIQPGYRHIPLWTEGCRPLSLSTLFCHISLNVFVFEGFSCVVDELSQPIKYQSAVEKRAEAICRIFDFEEDYDEVSDTYPTNTNGFSQKSPKGSYNSLPLVNFSPNNRRESTVTLSLSSSASSLQFNNFLLDRLPTQLESNLEAVNIEELKKDKVFTKLMKKHQKESDTLTKRLVKERTALSKTHNAALEKLFLNAQKNKENEKKTFERSKKKYSGSDLIQLQNAHEQKLAYLTTVQQQEVKAVINKQSEEWSNFISQQVKEELDLYDIHSPQKCSLLKKLLDAAHDSQLKVMEQRHERECSDLRKNQGKQSVETSKNAGKQIKCKEERERMLRELDRLNIKDFMEERQRLENRQLEEVDELKKFHKNEKEQLDINFQKEVKEHKDEIRLGEEALRKPFLFT